MTAPDTTLDAALDQIALSNVVHVVSAEPANHAGIAALSMGNQSLTAGDGGGDWTIANGDTSGRKITLTAQNSVSITVTDTAVGLAYTDGTTMHYYSPLSSSKAYTNGDTAQIPSYDVLEIQDPA
jgi:hypothetical protein